MSFSVHTCYTLICDRCKKPIESIEYEGATSVPHYDSPEDARKSLVGDPDDDDADGNAYLDGQRIGDEDVCGPCRDTQACAERGHAWTDWFPFHPDGNTLAHRYRWCDRSHCQARGEEPAAGVAS